MVAAKASKESISSRTRSVADLEAENSRLRKELSRRAWSVIS